MSDFAKGLEGVVAGQTAVSLINEEAGGCVIAAML